MITPADDGPDVDPDDPLVVVLRPPAEFLGPPPGRYEAIRRGAARRKLRRAAVGAGLVCAVAALVVLPLRVTSPEAPPQPTVPLAPPPASSPPASPPDPSVAPEPLPSEAPSAATPTVVPQSPGPSLPTDVTADPAAVARPSRV
ncbi:hypothetical protein [Streptomyces sp. CC219B]|uniref:hypothetical protein n=1 Tax=Streptomyces sp. CC219B TaxID=3044574 RepID=UPI0024A9581F|nr:hypothetical protein [Streptomyces sp. CC219B]